jgi:glycosyltransferase involved in cell wall biosynthesis
MAIKDRPPQRRRMLVICPFPVGVAAGQRLKYEQYFADWRAAGWDITVSPFIGVAAWNIVYTRGHYGAKVLSLLKGHFWRLRDMFRIPRFDLVYIHMWVTPLGTSLLERVTRSLAQRIVFDIEDNVLVGQSLDKRDNPNHLMTFLKGPGKARFLIRTADHVITSSPFLNDACLELNEKRACTYISSSVDTDRFLPVNPFAGTEGATIGWTGSHSTKVMLDLLRPVFQKLAQRVRFRVKVIGNFDYELPGVELEVVRWTAEREVTDLQTFDIGVYPLPTDEWVLGKSGLKAIQYMAFGLPTVATEVGITPMLIRSGENGILVRTEEEWLSALETLIRDPDLRRRLGGAARRDAVAKYSLHAIAAEYRRVIDDTMGGTE